MTWKQRPLLIGIAGICLLILPFALWILNICEVAHPYYTRGLVYGRTGGGDYMSVMHAVAVARPIGIVLGLIASVMGIALLIVGSKSGKAAPLQRSAAGRKPVGKADQ